MLDCAESGFADGTGDGAGAGSGDAYVLRTSLSIMTVAGNGAGFGTNGGAGLLDGSGYG